MKIDALKSLFHPTQNSKLVLILSMTLIVTSFILQGNVGFSLWDEGYLWYGVQRVMLGEVPKLDFQSYDPGRYYWSATLMGMLGDNGMMSLRKAVAVFQWIGLFTGLLLISKVIKKQSFFYLLLSGCTLIIWMFPRHKLFDISLSILLIAVLAYLIQSPTARRYYVTGLCIGFIAIFGRNHGIYGVVGSFGVMFWLNIRRESDITFMHGTWLWSIGVIVGFSPIFFMILLIPGFGAAFWESILFLFKLKATNIPLPVPWPWNIDFATVQPGNALRNIFVGLFFIGLLVFSILTLIWVIWRKYQNRYVHPVLVAASFLALPYTHFAFSRADVNHLAQGIFPLLIGCLVIFSGLKVRVKWSLAIILCVTSIWTMYIYHPAWRCYASRQCEIIDVHSDDLLVRASVANDVRLIKTMSDKYTPHGESFLVVPFWPGAYPLLDKKSPTIEIYSLFSRGEEFEKMEIERIKNAKPGFVLLFDHALDRRDELRYKNTHPLTYQYILNNFKRLSSSLSPKYQMFVAKDEAK